MDPLRADNFGFPILLYFDPFDPHIFRDQKHVTFWAILNAYYVFSWDRTVLLFLHKNTIIVNPHWSTQLFGSNHPWLQRLLSIWSIWSTRSNILRSCLIWRKMWRFYTFGIFHAYVFEGIFKKFGFWSCVWIKWIRWIKVFAVSHVSSFCFNLVGQPSRKQHFWSFITAFPL